MTEIAFKSIISIFFLMMLGIGPALILYRNSIDNALAVAPTIGLIFTTLIGSCLIVFDLPILSWAYTWLIVGSIFSLSIAAYSLRKYSYSLSKMNLIYLSLGFALVSFMLLMPMVYGELSFTALRGNAIDTFNYISLAGYLQHEPYSLGQHVDIDTLINKHPSYETAIELLPTRWSTSMLLGWFSIITRTSLQQCEYAFTAIFFILTYGCNYSLFKQAGLKNSYIILASIAICAGFWAQFVMDIRAMSHITVLPLLILFTILIERIEKKDFNWQFQILFGLLLTSIALLYIEILPFIALGIILFFVMELFQKKQTLLHIFKNYILAFFITAVTLYCTSNKYLINFFINQLHYANNIKNNWHEAYFAWFYKHPLLSFWGLLSSHSGIIKILFTCLSISLTFFLIYLIFCNIFKKENPSLHKILVGMMLASIMIALYLKFNGQLWAAGKAFSYGYPFIILFLTLTIFITLQTSTESIYIKIIGKSLIILFLMIQCGFGLLRITQSNSQNIYYAQTIAVLSDYHHHDFNIQAMTHALKSNKAKSLGLITSNELIRKYLENTWGWDLKVIDLFGNALVQTKHFDLPEYIITDIQDTLLSQYSILEKNSELMLVKLNSNSSIEQIPLAAFTYSDNWLKLNQTITLPTALIKKIEGATLTLKGNLFSKYFNGPIDLKLQINENYIQHKVIYPGEFEWKIPIEKLSKINNKLDFLFTSNKILDKKLDSRSLSVHMESVTIARNNNSI